MYIFIEDLNKDENLTIQTEMTPFHCLALGNELLHNLSVIKQPFIPMNGNFEGKIEYKGLMIVPGTLAIYEKSCSYSLLIKTLICLDSFKIDVFDHDHMIEHDMVSEKPFEINITGLGFCEFESDNYRVLVDFE